jgi:hypothetical protein
MAQTRTAYRGAIASKPTTEELRKAIMGTPLGEAYKTYGEQERQVATQLFEEPTKFLADISDPANENYIADPGIRLQIADKRRSTIANKLILIKNQLKEKGADIDTAIKTFSDQYEKDIELKKLDYDQLTDLYDSVWEKYKLDVTVGQKETEKAAKANEGRQIIASSAQRVLDVLDKNGAGFYKTIQEFETALNYAVSDYNKRAFIEAGKTMPTKEYAVIAGTQIKTLERIPTALERANALITGYLPAGGLKVDEDMSSIRQKMNLAIQTSTMPEGTEVKKKLDEVTVLPEEYKVEAPGVVSLEEFPREEAGYSIKELYPGRVTPLGAVYNLTLRPIIEGVKAGVKTLGAGLTQTAATVFNSLQAVRSRDLKYGYELAKQAQKTADPVKRQRLLTESRNISQRGTVIDNASIILADSALAQRKKLGIEDTGVGTGIVSTMNLAGGAGATIDAIAILSSYGAAIPAIAVKNAIYNSILFSVGSAAKAARERGMAAVPMAAIRGATGYETTGLAEGIFGETPQTRSIDLAISVLVPLIFGKKIEKKVGGLVGELTSKVIPPPEPTSLVRSEELQQKAIKYTTAKTRAGIARQLENEKLPEWRNSVRAIASLMDDEFGEIPLTEMGTESPLERIRTEMARTKWGKSNPDVIDQIILDSKDNIITRELGRGDTIQEFSTWSKLNEERERLNEGLSSWFRGGRKVTNDIEIRNYLESVMSKGIKELMSEQSGSVLLKTILDAEATAIKVLPGLSRSIQKPGEGRWYYKFPLAGETQRLVNMITDPLSIHVARYYLGGKNIPKVVPKEKANQIIEGILGKKKIVQREAPLGARALSESDNQTGRGGKGTESGTTLYNVGERLNPKLGTSRPAKSSNQKILGVIARLAKKKSKLESVVGEKKDYNLAIRESNKTIRAELSESASGLMTKIKRWAESKAYTEGDIESLRKKLNTEDQKILSDLTDIARQRTGNSDWNDDEAFRYIVDRVGQIQKPTAIPERGILSRIAKKYKKAAKTKLYVGGL